MSLSIVSFNRPPKRDDSSPAKEMFPLWTFIIDFEALGVSFSVSVCGSANTFFFPPSS
jgi:hypothetical protein